MHDPTKRASIVVICGVPVAMLDADYAPVLFEELEAHELRAVREVITHATSEDSASATWLRVGDLIDKKLSQEKS